MKTKSVPAIIMLLAGLIACLAGIRARMEVGAFLKMLIIVLLIFYMLGCLVKMLLDRNFAETKDEETTDGDGETDESEPGIDEEDEAETEDEADAGK